MTARALIISLTVLGHAVLLTLAAICFAVGATTGAVVELALCVVLIVAATVALRKL